MLTETRNNGETTKHPWANGVFSYGPVVIVCVLFLGYALRDVHGIDRLPISNEDMAHHFATAEMGGEAVRASGQLLGYSTRFAAGYPVTPGADVGNLAGVALYWLFGKAFVLPFNIFLIGHFVALPLLLFLSCKLIWERTDAGKLALLCWLPVYWQGFGRRWLIGGMYGFSAVSAVSVFVICAYYKFFTKPSCRSATAASMGTLLLPLLHPLCVFIVPVPVLAILLYQCRRVPLWTYGVVAGCLSLNLVIYAFWWMPMISTWHLMPSLNAFFRVDAFGGVLAYLRHYWFTFSNLKAATRSIGVLFLAGLGCAGLIMLLRRGDWKRLVTLGVTVTYLAVLTFVGATCKVLEGQQTIRYQLPLAYTLSVLAGGFLAGVMVYVERKCRRLRFANRVLLLVLVASECVVALQMASAPVFRVKACAQLEAAYTWIEKHCDNSSRLLAEETSTSRFSEERRILDGYSTSLTQLRTGVALANIPYPFPVVRGTGQLRFRENRAFGIRLSTCDESEWRRACDLLNIGYILAYTEEAKQALARFPEYCRPVYGSGCYQIYHVVRKKTYVLRGKGVMSFIDNRIELSNVAPSSEGVVLSLFWPVFLKARDANGKTVGLSGVKLASGLPEFVAIREPSERVFVSFVDSSHAGE